MGIKMRKRDGLLRSFARPSPQHSTSIHPTPPHTSHPIPLPLLSFSHKQAFRIVSHEDVRGRVSDRIYGMVDEFYECGECLKVGSGGGGLG